MSPTSDCNVPRINADGIMLNKVRPRPFTKCNRANRATG